MLSLPHEIKIVDTGNNHFEFKIDDKLMSDLTSEQFRYLEGKMGIAKCRAFLYDIQVLTNFLSATFKSGDTTFTDNKLNELVDLIIRETNKPEYELCYDIDQAKAEFKKHVKARNYDFKYTISQVSFLIRDARQNFFFQKNQRNPANDDTDDDTYNPGNPVPGNPVIPGNPVPGNPVIPGNPVPGNPVIPGNPVPGNPVIPNTGTPNTGTPSTGTPVTDNTTEEESLWSMAIKSLKASLQESIDKKNLQHQLILHKGQDLQNSAAFEKSADEKHRESINKFLDIISNASGQISGDDLVSFVEIIGQQIKAIEQNISELRVIKDSLSFDANYVSFKFTNFINKADTLKKDLSKCRDIIVFTDKENVAPSGTLAKALRKLSKMDIVQLHNVRSNNELVIPRKTNTEQLYSFSNTISAVTYKPNKTILSMNTALNPQQIAVLQATHNIANITDAFNSAIHCWNLCASQQTLNTNNIRGGTSVLHSLTPPDIISLNDSLNNIVQNDGKKRAVTPLVKVSKTIPTSILGNTVLSEKSMFLPVVNNTHKANSEQGEILLEINNLLNSKINNVLNQSITPFNPDVIKTSSSEIEPFPANYTLVNGTPTFSNFDIFLRLPDAHFVKNAVIIKEKLHKALRAYEVVKTILSQIKQTTINDVEITTPDESGGLITGKKTIKEIVENQINIMQQLLELKRVECITCANDLLLSMIDNIKMKALEKTINSTNKELTDLLKLISDLKYMIPTDEEIILNNTLQSTSSSIKSFTTSVINMVLKLGVISYTLIVIPFSIISTAINMFTDVLASSSLKEKQIKYVREFTSKAVDLLNESIASFVGMYDVYDQFIFEIEKSIPVFRTILNFGLSVLIFAIATQNTQCSQVLSLLLDSLIPVSTHTKNINSFIS